MVNCILGRFQSSVSREKQHMCTEYSLPFGSFQTTFEKINEFKKQSENERTAITRKFTKITLNTYKNPSLLSVQLIALRRCTVNNLKGCGHQVTYLHCWWSCSNILENNSTPNS